MNVGKACNGHWLLMNKEIAFISVVPETENRSSI